MSTVLATHIKACVDVDNRWCPDDVRLYIYIILCNMGGIYVIWQIIIQFAQDTDGSHDNAQYLTFCETL